MEITAARRDALSELINIGYGRAAAALSEMTHDRVLLQAPDLSLHPITEIAAQLKGSISGSVTCVNQTFSGPIAGNAMLLLNAEASRALATLLEPRSDSASIMASDVLNETGNILLNACLGVFGNLLSVQVSFALARVEVNAVEHLLSSITAGWEPLSHALVVKTKFVVANSDVSGVLLIIFGVTSLERLMLQVDRWSAA